MGNDELKPVERTDTSAGFSEVFPRGQFPPDSQAIYAQEKRGQASLVNSDTLPAKISAKTKAKLEERGVKFLGPVSDDPLFQYVRLPEGWRKVPTDHDMWSELRDERCKVRGSIFYKAAAYDRRAFIS